MCQICGYSAPADFSISIESRYAPGCGFCSTPGRNIGFIPSPLQVTGSVLLPARHGNNRKPLAARAGLCQIGIEECRVQAEARIGRPQVELWAVRIHFFTGESVIAIPFWMLQFGDRTPDYRRTQ